MVSELKGYRDPIGSKRQSGDERKNKSPAPEGTILTFTVYTSDFTAALIIWFLQTGKSPLGLGGSHFSAQQKREGHRAEPDRGGPVPIET